MALKTKRIMCCLTPQIVEGLDREVDRRSAQGDVVNRSSLIREALELHLKQEKTHVKAT